jgi:hypothetical protein
LSRSVRRREWPQKELSSAGWSTPAGVGVHRSVYPAEYEGRIVMLYTIAVVLIVLWLLGLVSSYTMGGFIHVLLVIAVIVVLLNLIQGRRVL